MDLQHIALSKLKLAAVNVRHSRREPDVSDILPSIRARGVLQPLLVRPSAKSFEIVAGRRRFFAVSKVAEEQGVSLDEVTVPCAVTAKGDDAGAVEASLIENIAREPMDELQEYEAFARLIKEGRKVDEIAATFGATEIYVKQRLALANLHAKIKDAYRNGDLEAEDMQLLTVATRQQQKQWVEAFTAESDPDQDADEAPRGYHLKQWLFGGNQIATTAALFPLETYTGDIITDLFGEVSYFDDREAFWSLQNAAIAKLRDELAAKGWSEVVVLEKGYRFQTWQHDSATLEDGGKAFIEVRESGEVETHEGFVPHNAKPSRPKTRSESGETKEGGASNTPKPEVTKAAENYLALHRHAIVRAELLTNPQLALRFVVAQLIAGSSLWNVKAEPQRAEKEAIAASVASSCAQQAFETERQAVLQLLGLEASHLGTVVRGNADGFWAATVLARLLALPDEAVLRILTLVMAETLEVGTALVEAAGSLLKVDVVRWWTADDTFLDLIRDRAALNGMLAEVAGRAVADANLSEPARVQKKIMRDCLAGEGRLKVESWVPRHMAFPPATYDAAKTLQGAANWQAVKDLFTGS